jgi:hypothetical protein
MAFYPVDTFQSYDKGFVDADKLVFRQQIKKIGGGLME